MARSNLELDTERLMGGPVQGVRLTVQLANKSKLAVIGSEIVDSFHVFTGVTNVDGMVTLAGIPASTDYRENDKLNDGLYSYSISFPNGVSPQIGTFTKTDGDSDLLDEIDG